LLNLENGMLDLRTGELLHHAPEYASCVQFPVVWNPNAKAPVYEAWLASQIPDQAADLEEAASAVLDQSVTPAKALFLFGPSRSGKSTFLRIIQEVVGRANYSGVSLHQLSDDRFAAANVYGKALNVSGDLSAAHVEDISMFKKMTGEDLIQANRKFGGQFPFTSRALFVFSANELPTVGEGSRAYFERIKPFRFGVSFAGREDPTLELAMLEELPGILVRWVSAWQARRARGTALVTDPAVAARFEIASDKVRRFVDECCEGVEMDGDTVEKVVTTVELYAAFKEWSNQEGTKALARSRFTARLETLPGVARARGRADRKRGWALKIHPTNSWGEGNMSDSHTVDESIKDSRGQSGQLSTTAREFEMDVSLEVESMTHSSMSHSGKKLPVLPALTSLAKDVDSGMDTTTLLKGASPVDRLFRELGDTSTHDCTECGTPEVLVDGTWLACPVCHPNTARTTETESTKEA
jgi:P4 family phage/plasmid primase-like protien